MRRRYLWLPIACALGATVAIVPSLAQGSPAPSTASFTAVDYAWDVTGRNTTEATIAQGGTVTFAYPSGSSEHNADFGTGAQPSSCTQTAGTSSGPVPPLPHQATARGWSGTCTFNTPGTYTFHCDLHPYMTATIVVQGSGTTTGTTTTNGTTGTTATTTTTLPAPGTTTTTPITTAPPTAGTSTPTPTPTTASTGTVIGTQPGPTSPATGPATGGSPFGGGAAHGVVVKARQRGAIVRGSVKISPTGTGGRLRGELLASLTALGLGRGPQVEIGQFVRGGLRAGTLRFSIAPDSRAKRALKRRHQLAITVRIVATSSHGIQASATREVTLRI